MTQREMKKLRRTAIHEAGHAVVALQLEIRFKHISIIEEDDCLGHVKFYPMGKNFHPDYDNSTSTFLKAEKLIMRSLGGICAELIHLKGHNRAQASADKSNFIDMAIHICGSPEEVSAYLKYLKIRTKGILSNSQNREAVLRITEKLLTDKRISYKVAKKIYRDAFFDAMNRARRLRVEMGDGAQTPGAD